MTQQIVKAPSLGEGFRTMFRTANIAQVLEQTQGVKHDEAITAVSDLLLYGFALTTDPLTFETNDFTSTTISGNDIEGSLHRQISMFRGKTYETVLHIIVHGKYEFAIVSNGPGKYESYFSRSTDINGTFHGHGGASEAIERIQHGIAMTNNYF